MFATERDLPVALWIDTPALGDTIAAIPTLRKLSKAFEDKPLTVFTSNPSLFDGHPLVYQALHSDEPKDGYKLYHTFWPLVGKTYDLTGSKVEFRHSNTEIRQFHAMSLGFSLTTEELEMDLYCEEELDLGIEDYVLIHPTHTWPTRTWEQAKWQELVDRLNAKGIPVVAVGKDSAEVGTFSVQKPVMDIDIKVGLNLLNDPRTNIAALRWMMNHKAKVVVTMDSGILHVAGTTDVDIIQLGSSIDPKLRAPWRKGSQDYKYQYVAGGCDIFCSSNMRYNSRVHGSIHGVPPQINCLEDKPTFECHPTVDQVFDTVTKLYDMKRHFDFIEIGTSDFDALIETATDEMVGISVEPITKYLDSLPNKKNVIKLNAAISDHEGFAPIYYIEDNKIEQHNLPWWVKGSNSIFKPHPFCIKELGEEFYNEMVTVKDVPLISIKTLFKDYNVGSVDLLKVDTEGHDHVILRSYLDMCKENPEFLADRLIFEMHDVVSSPEMHGIVKEFKDLGYTGYRIKEEYFMFKNGFEIKIPKVIHQTFKSLDALDVNLLESVNLLKEQNPDWEYRFYSDEDCIEFIKTNYDQETLDLYLSINETYGAARADLFRYLLMYKEGGVYLDIKSGAVDRLSNLIHPETEYVLTHWPGKDFADELGYKLGEFQNWHIITVPGHPFLARTIELVKENLRRLKLENTNLSGKGAVLRTTGPIVYSKAILELLDSFEHTTFTAPVKHYALESEAGLKYTVCSKPHWDSYKSYALETSNLIKNKSEKAYVYYGNEAYLETIKASIKALRQFSNLPVLVYALDSDQVIDLDGVKTIKWQTGSNGNEIATVTDESGNYFIDRQDPNVYTILIERPNIVKHALEHFADSVAYIDADSIAMPWVDRIFDLYQRGAGVPYFTTGIHDYLHIGNRGGAMTKDDLSTTLEHEACLLFDVDQKVREIYRQSGYFVADQSCLDFLDEWYQMCNHPEVLNDFTKYAPYHEETILNVLLWKKHIIFESLPLIYVNGSVEMPKILSEIKFNGEYQQFGGWLKVPGKLEDIMFIHGEKRPEIMNQITDEIIKHNMRKKRLLYIAPHLSTGGMPQFLQTRVEAMLSADEYEVHVLEYNQYATDYVVQRNRIQGLLAERFWSIGQLHEVDHDQRGDMMKQIIEKIQPDLIHIEESPEAFDNFNRVNPSILSWLYEPTHNWKIVETCHNIWFNAQNKQYTPDAMMYCTPYHPIDNFKKLEDSNILSAVVPYPLFDHIPTTSQKDSTKKYLDMDPNKIHVLNIGLWTSGKNQAEGVEIARIAEEQFPGKFQFHFVGNQAPNFQEYWDPIMQNLPTNVTVWGERSDTKSFMVACDAFMFNSTWECSPLALREAISHGMITFSRNLPQYLDTFTPYIVPFSNDLTENASTLIQRLTGTEELFGTFTLPKDDFARFQQQHLDLYGRTLSQIDGPVRPTLVPADSEAPEFKGRLEHPGSLRLHVDQLSPGKWSAEFYDMSNDELVHRADGLQQGHWYGLTRRWHTDWLVKVLHNGKLYTELQWTLEDKECYVQFETGSLGDTLSWVGQMVNFKQHHGIKKLYVSTAKNWLFDHEWYAKYNIQFIDQLKDYKPCTITLGVYFDQEEPWRRWEHKYDWRTVTLGKIASDRLGIEYQEVRPRLASQFTHGSVKVERPYVVIATQSTAQAKYWNNPTGWQELTKWYNEQGMDVYHASKEGIAPEGTIQTPEELDVVAAYIRGAKHFVGISSGLSWFAWALGAKVILISGFTDPYVEFKDKAYYVNNHQYCHGCWGTRVFDRNDWMWCPDWKGTARHFECSKKISSQQVIEVAEKLLHAPEPTFIKNKI